MAHKRAYFLILYFHVLHGACISVYSNNQVDLRIAICLSNAILFNFQKSAFVSKLLTNRWTSENKLEKKVYLDVRRKPNNKVTIRPDPRVQEMFTPLSHLAPGGLPVRGIVVFVVRPRGGAGDAVEGEMAAKVLWIVSSTRSKCGHLMNIWEGNRRRMEWGWVERVLGDRSSKQDLMPHRLRTDWPRAWTAGAAGHLKLTRLIKKPSKRYKLSNKFKKFIPPDVKVSQFLMVKGQDDQLKINADDLFDLLNHLQHSWSEVGDDYVSPGSPHASQDLHQCCLQIKCPVSCSMVDHGILSRNLKLSLLILHR